MTGRPQGLGVTVIGAGPAGLSAALWLHDFDVPFSWFEATSAVGGTLRRVHNRIKNYPGCLYRNGMDLAQALERHLQDRSLSPTEATLESIDLSGGPPILTLDGELFTASRVILALGTRYRTLDVPGEAEGLGKWVSQSAMADAPRFAGRGVAVVGGGDAAYENALRLARQGCSVKLLMRSEPRARVSFLRAVEEHPAIEVAPVPTVVNEIEPTVRGCVLSLDRAGEPQRMEVAGLFVRIGVDPLVVDGMRPLRSDREGFLLVDDDGRTSHRQVFAVGDITSRPLRSVATAVGQGALAAQACARELNFL